MGYLRGYYTPSTDQLINYLTDRIIATFNRTQPLLWSAPATMKRIARRLVYGPQSALRKAIQAAVLPNGGSSDVPTQPSEESHASPASRRSLTASGTLDTAASQAAATEDGDDQAVLDLDESTGMLGKGGSIRLPSGAPVPGISGVGFSLPLGVLSGVDRHSAKGSQGVSEKETARDRRQMRVFFRLLADFPQLALWSGDESDDRRIMIAPKAVRMVLRSEEPHNDGTMPRDASFRLRMLRQDGLRFTGRRIASQMLIRFAKVRAWAAYDTSQIGMDSRWGGQKSGDPSSLWLARAALHESSESSIRQSAPAKHLGRHGPSSRRVRSRSGSRAHGAGAASRDTSRHSSSRGAYLVPIMRETELQCIYQSTEDGKGGKSSEAGGADGGAAARHSKLSINVPKVQACGDPSQIRGLVDVCYAIWGDPARPRLELPAQAAAVALPVQPL